MLWEFNRFLPENPCQTGTLAKTLLLIFIDVAILATISIILPPAPSVLQEGSPDACVYTRGSVRRASGFVLTGKPEVICSSVGLVPTNALVSGNPILQVDRQVGHIVVGDRRG